MKSLGVFLLPVFKSFGASVASINSLFAWSPLGWTNFSVLVTVLECLDESEDLIDVPAYGEVIELTVSEDSISIDDEGGSKVESFILG